MSIVGRIAYPLLGGAFVTSGVETIIDPGPRAQEVREAGLDELAGMDATTLTRATAAVQVGAGLMLATNRMPRVAALVLGGTLATATLSSHRFWAVTDKQERGQERAQFVSNLGLLGGLLAVLATPRRHRRRRNKLLPG